ncbi:MAG: MerR family transcriptional regulator [Alistipes sp.]|nr:MerR family transcriptional regulator [Alistipes sp.]
MAETKLYYSMGEVAEMFDVNPSLIRHWESKFDCVKPHKNKKGNRMFSPQDVEKLKLIYHLVKERGMTLEGANKVLKRRSDSELSREMELLERLQRIRASLVEVREELKGDGQAEFVVSNSVDEAFEEQSEALVAEQASEQEAESVVEPSAEEESASVEAQKAEVEAEVQAEPKAERKRKNVVQKISDDDKEVVASEQPKKRTVRRKKKEEEKELFPFYEQSLF